MSTLRKVLDLLTPRERTQALWMVPLVVIMALAEVVGVASIAPFLSLMSDSGVERDGMLGWAYATFGFTSERSFRIFVGVAVIVLLVGSNVVLTAGYWALFRFGSLRNHSISRRLLIRYLQQPYEFFLTNNSAALANNVLQEVTQIVQGIIVPGLLMIAKGVAALAIVAFLVVVDPLLAVLIAGALGGGYLLVYFTVRARLMRIGRDRVAANQARHRTVNEAMGGIEAVKLTGREGHMVARFSDPSRRLALYQASSRIMTTIPRFALEAIAFGSIVAVVLALLASGEGVANVVPVLGLFAFAGYRLLPNLQHIFATVGQIRYSSGALDEVHAIFTGAAGSPADVEESEAFHQPQRSDPLPFDRRIRLEDVGFSYPGSAPILEDVDLEIAAKSSVALVGSTGAGKTTLIGILLGLLRPTQGTIQVDEIALDPSNLARWQAQVGYVPQHIFLTDDTIARNIAFGLADDLIDMEAVRRAAAMAQIQEFIEEQLEAGYQTMVGERGVRLSGGQRQRLGIARALYHDPEVLVLDEATSALDAITEANVFQAIEELAGRKTLVIIAHRLATTRACDRIFVLDAGRIAASGTYDELVASNPIFRRMASEDGTGAERSRA